ncbi:MAG: uracil-DNA glycosylase family 4 [Planctomycetota bacterium]|jgi:uracil-DNA glycosylase family 4
MLSARQQHCLKGIGIRYWVDRSAALVMQAADSVAEPIVDSQAQIEEVAPPVETAPLPVVARQLDNWDQISASITHCQACELAKSCTQKVAGTGNLNADVLIIGEGPGHDEDIQGEPFVGRSGKLLDKILATIGLSRDQVYITNIVKCRPPNNRDPRAEEAKQCRAFLDAQIKQIAPRVILSVGRISAQNLLESNLPVGKLISGKHRLPESEIPVKVTYHPSYLLRNPAAKSIAWEGLKELHSMLAND